MKKTNKLASALVVIAGLLLLCGCPKVSAQTPVTLSPYSRQQFFDSSGRPLAFGKVCTFQAGGTTPLATYTDSSGNFQNANPLILDAGGYGSLWLTANAYKLVLKTAGTDSTCNTGTQQYMLDNVTPPPFLAGNNSWTGNQSFAGTSTFNGAATFSAGGSFSGTFSGSPTLSGNPNFSGTPNFAGVPLFPGGISIDTITGTVTNGVGTLLMIGHAGAAATAGENVSIVGGAPGTGTANGGQISLHGNNGGATGGIGGDVVLFGGIALGGSANGGSFGFTGGAGSGAGQGGQFSVVAGNGGNTAGQGGTVHFAAGGGGVGGNGGNIDLIPGAKGAGGQDGYIVVGGSGRFKYSTSATAVAPSCSSTGLGGLGTCTLANYSTDSSGVIALHAAAGAAALGTVTLTFNQSMGANGSFCTFGIQQGSGTWDPRSTVFTQATGASTVFINWDDNAIALANGSIYNISYVCRGAL